MDGLPLEEASREKVFAAERNIAGLRVVIVALNTVVYHFLMPKAGTWVGVAYAIIVVANAYGVFVYFGKPYERFPLLMSSWFTTISDAALITVWIAATGGFDSPFHLLWLVSITAVAFRFGPKETAFAAGVYAVSYLGLLGSLGQLGGNAADITLRVGYIFLTAAIGMLFAQETVDQTRAKLEMRDLAEMLKESEERFRRLSDAAFEGIALHDGGRVLECNRAFASMFGYAPSEVIGRNAFEFVHPDDHEEISERLRVATDSPFELRGRRKNGGTFDIEMVSRDAPFRGRTVRVTAVRDITERKAAENERREREKLAAVNANLRLLDKERTQLINNAAHELGTPLTPIRLQTHILKSKRIGPLTERQEKALGIVDRNVRHLTRLVGDVLDVSRIQAGRFAVVLESVDLGATLSEAVESFEAPALADEIQLRLEAPSTIPVRADPTRITQVLFNLIHNALKFTPPGGNVDVTARIVGERVEIAVRDTGAGIAEADIPRLFQPFSQVHDKMERTKSGTGLGLFIAKGIVDQHGGTIACESPGIGKGSTFTLTLPLADSGVGAPAE